MFLFYVVAAEDGQYCGHSHLRGTSYRSESSLIILRPQTDTTTSIVVVTSTHT